ncbi:MAG: VOC family protein [Gammaproteobacteria bacterium]|nr:VOC family protein [Gammaproteobacteria bacterium]MDH5628733.1 VOC family protein [Gammaproteobacteria bacterium]
MQITLNTQNLQINKIHHINFIVKDLEEAVIKYKKLLGGCEFIIDDLPQRKVKTARTLIGEQWFVLVQPTSDTGIPAEHLKEHGEGFFLLSFAVDDLEANTKRLEKEGFTMTAHQPRKGLENWHIRDVDSKQTNNAQIQFCQEID